MRFAKYFILICFLFLIKNNLHAQCKANFVAQSKACESQTVLFQYIDSTKSHTVLWDFGDVFSGASNTSTDSFSSHVFLSFGTYTITLIVKDTSGCIDTVKKSITIFKKPIADFTYSNNCANLKSIFTSTSAADLVDTLKKHVWYFGNGDSALGLKTNYTFSSTGSKTITHYVVSNFGCRDTVVKTMVQHPTPKGTPDIFTICKNNQVNFTADALTGASNYIWDFGDASSFSQQNIAHIYNQLGWIYPKLTVDFAGEKCSIAIDSIFVKKLPDANFTLSSGEQCYKKNKVCVKLSNTKQKIKFRSVFFDDGFVDDNSPIGDSIICHTYSDPAGGKYSITLELTDSSNCTASTTQKDALVVHQEIVAGFSIVKGNGCFKTDVQLTNTTNQTPPLVQKYYWDFGDGNIDSTDWNNFNYTYTSDGSFKIKLWVKNIYGCIDSIFTNQPVVNTNFIVDAKIDSSSGICRNNNQFWFKQTPISGATVEWDLKNGAKLYNFTSVGSYNRPGLYYPTALISKNGCDSMVQLDSILIHGPYVLFGNTLNRFQCQIKDTVQYTNNTQLFYNKSAVVKWDAGDPFASNCISNTKDGINVNSNCRYSSDSFSFKHMYKKGQDGCYTAMLKVTDTVLGCSDSAYIPIALMAPKAKGLFFPSNANPCPGPDGYKTVSFNINLPQPSCVKYAWWVMWDSLAAIKTGNFDSNWRVNSTGHNYQYNDYAGDSLGRVSIGLIVENGLDTNGTVCRDTGWFTQIVKVTRINPKFTSSYSPLNQYCKNSKFKFSLVDSMLDSISYVQWIWGDGTQTMATDLNSKFHTYTKAGKYTVISTMVHKNGCTGIDSMHLSVGFFSEVTIPVTEHCVKGKLVINNNNYYTNPINGNNAIWKDTLRTNSGKEKVRYDLNDGNGFQYLGPNPTVSYNHPGNYAVRMESRDSAGCLDTVTAVDVVRVSGIYASFIGPKDTVLCPQSIKFTSTSTVVDSTVMQSRAGDVVQAYDWDYGPAYPKNQIKNPQRFFNTGVYPIKLIVTNKYGCKDSVKKQLVIIGPIAKFKFVSDTVGCEPLKVTFDNLSVNASNYIWKFSDITNSTFISNQDTNISIKYKGYGKFYPKLVARGTFISNGIQQVCESIFPDTGTVIKKEVTVYELPKPDFTYVTNCATVTTDFKNNTKITTGNVVNVKWYFGDGSTSTNTNPSHQYSDTGTYRVVLKSFSDKGCEDSMVKKIVISPLPIAKFGYTSTCFPKPTSFKDSSFAYNDRIYLWNWSFGDNQSSNLKNPFHTYIKDSTYNVKLKITNVAGCSDSITKSVIVFSKPFPNFTFANVCEKNTATFNNISTSKKPTANWTWKMGEGTVYTTNNVSHKYLIAQNYNVKLIQETVDGCKDSITKTFTLYPKPIAKFVVDKTNSCFKANVFKFTDSSKIKSGTKSIKFYFGDKDSSIASKPSHSYLIYGNYNSKLIVTSNFNCKDTYSVPLEVYPMPVSNFTINVTNQCHRYNNYVFTDQGSIPVGYYSRLWQLGNGNTGTDSILNYHYPDTGKFTIKLILNSNKGCKDTSSKSVQLYPMPVAIFTVNDDAQCLRGNAFKFTNNSKIAWGNIYPNWQFGDGNSSTLLNPSHVYATYGKYNVRLILNSNLNCVDTNTQQIEVFPMPVAAYNVNNSSQCLRNNSFVFNNNSSIPYGTLGYNWKFGDGNTSTATNPTHTYATEGIYSCYLHATSVEGCADTVAQNMAVRPMPIVGFTINKSGQCINNHNFIFDDTSKISSGANSRQWNFGDTTFSVAKTPTKKYNYHAVFNVKLVQQSNWGCMDSLTKQVTVYPKPFVSFSTNDTDQCLRGNVFQFTNNSTVAYGTNNYTWNFGDGNSLLSNNATHSYSNYKSYKVVLKALSNFSCTDSFVNTMWVYPMPQADFAINDSEQCFRQNNFSFTNKTTIGYGTLKHFWDYGNGDKDTNINASKIYTNIGNYKVQLISVSTFNCSDTISKVTTVDPMPVVDFVINKDSQCINQQNFIFTDNSSIASGSIARNWSFGDGASSVLQSPSHYFNLDTSFKIKLVQTSNKACMDSITKQIVVHSKPYVIFLPNDSQQCLRQNNYEFINSTKIKKGTINYNWLFGDGNNATAIQPKHIYNAHGNYLVKLFVTSNYGCIDSLTKGIRVSPMPNVVFTTNDTGQCINNQLFNFTNLSTIAEGTLSHQWKFGDGNTNTSFNASHQYAADIKFKVWLIEKSSENCWDSVSAMMDVFPKPNLNFAVNDSQQCLRQNKYVFNNSTNIKYGTLSHHWTFGNSKFADSAQPLHIYSTHGNYEVSLYSTSDLNCVDSLKKWIRVSPMPIVAFKTNDTGQCINNQNFVFTNSSAIAEGTLSHLWKFGDDSISTNYHSIKQYLNDVKYRVTLIESSSENCMDSLSAVMDVFPKPTVAFTVNDSIQCLRQNNYIFSNKSVIKYGNLSYNWNLSDGFSDTTLNLIHKFSLDSNFTIKLKTTSNLGCTDTAQANVVVGSMPAVDFVINNPSQCLREQSFKFTNLSKVKIGPLKHSWNLGDATSDTNYHIQHIYSNTGNYFIKIVETTQYNCMDSVEKAIWVHPNGKAHFTTNDSDQCLNQQNYIFTDNSTIAPGKIVNLNWDLGNNQTSNLSTVKAFYNKSGSYRIRLITTSDSGCIDSFVNYTRVYPKPNAYFNVDDSAQCLFQNKYVFNDASFDSAGLANYLWNINNENKQSTVVANYVFKSFGFKNIELIATSIRGCADTFSRKVYVKPMPDPAFEPLKDYYCELTGPYVFVPTVAGGNYFGANINANIYNPIRLWQDTVKYVVTVNGCTDSSARYTQVYPGPKVNLGNDTTVCKKEVLNVDASFWNSTYLWSDGSKTPVNRFTKPGTYWVTVTNICGVKSDTLRLDYRDINCRFFLPTAFTPNGDTKNDYYKPVLFNVDEMTLQIFDRWGGKVYEGDINSKGWDGNIKGQYAPNGVYVVRVTYKYTSGTRKFIQSESTSMNLIR